MNICSTLLLACQDAIQHGQIFDYCCIVLLITFLSYRIKICSTASSVNSLLYMRIYCNHAVVEIPVFPHEYLRVPGHGNKDRIDSAGKGSSKNVANLKANL